MQPFQTIERSTRIATILARYGFHELLENTPLEQHSRPQARVKDTFPGNPQKFRQLLEDLGPTFIKLGQLLSTRPDLLTPEFAEELGKLQEGVKPVAYEKIKARLEEIYQDSLDAKLGRIYPEPLATASIAQIHRAELPGGNSVILKIKKPGIDRIIRADLDILEILLDQFLKIRTDLVVHQPGEILAYFRDLLEKELDMLAELANIERIHQQTDETSTALRPPQVYRRLSNRDVLVMEWIEGSSIQHHLKSKTTAAPVQQMARRCATSLLEDIFLKGFFHGDPHPGNFLVRGNSEIIPIDFGLVGQMDQETRHQLADLVGAVAQREISRATDMLLDLSTYQEPPNRKRLETDVADFVTKHFYQPLEHLRLGAALNDLLSRLSAHRLCLPSSIYIMVKALGTMEGWVKRADPEFDVIEASKPLVKQARFERFRPDRLQEDLLHTTYDIFQLLKGLPRNIEALFDKLKHGEVKVHIAHEGLDPIREVSDQLATRLSAAILTASLIVGSSLILHAHIPPTWNDISILGLLGYLVAGIEGVRILFGKLSK